MLSLYEILRASKTGIAPDMWTALAGKNWGSADSGHEIKELTGIPPLTFRADGTPLLDFLISGNMSQSGTPTPQNPIQPSECGERTGNLYNYATNETGYRIQWVTGNSYADATAIMSDYIPVSAGNYSLDTGFLIVGYDTNKSYVGVYRVEGRWERGNSQQVTLLKVAANSGVAYVKLLSYGGYPALSSTNMLNVGSTALPYEPYGIKIPISSANTTAPVYLGEVETTRKIKKYEFTGQENWRVGSGFFYLGTISPDYLRARDTITYVCTHYTVYPQTGFGANVPNKNIALGSDPNNQRVYLKDDDMADVTDFKTYLQQQYAAGTPVTVWYVLATPQTAVINEPLRKIGDYADTLSMEQAGAQIPTNRGNTVIDVETTLKPSQMYIKYQE